MDAGTYYEAKEIEAILSQVSKLISQRRPSDADALLDEFGLREWICGDVD